MDADRVEGKSKQLEGEAQESWGKTKDTADDLWDEAKEKGEGAWEKVKDAVDGDDEDASSRERLGADRV
ncbi:MAG: hypothetical protein ACRC50_00650 [Gaiella sp.]